MQADVLLRRLKQLGHLVLFRSDRLILQADVQPSLAIADLVEEKPGLGFVAHRASITVNDAAQRRVLLSSERNVIFLLGLRSPSLFSTGDAALDCLDKPDRARNVIEYQETLVVVQD